MSFKQTQPIDGFALTLWMMKHNVLNSTLEWVGARLCETVFEHNYSMESTGFFGGTDSCCCPKKVSLILPVHLQANLKDEAESKKSSSVVLIGVTYRSVKTG